MTVEQISGFYTHPWETVSISKIEEAAQQDFVKKLQRLSWCGIAKAARSWSHVSGHRVVQIAPQSLETPTNFAQRIYREHGNYSRPELHGTIHYRLELSPDKFCYYASLQKHLAALVPNEWERPTIDLHIHGSEVRHNAPPRVTVGIAGGMGILVDVAVLESVLERLSPQELRDISVHVYSAPYPFSRFQKMVRSVNYIAFLSRFMRSKYDHYFITCNTAHNYLNLYTWLMASDQEEKLRSQSLISRVVNELAGLPHKPNVLLLGTYRSYQSNLYAAPLEEESVGVKQLAKVDAYFIQHLINVAKKGHTLQPVETAQFKALVKRYKRLASEEGTPLTHVLLGCTELPLLFANNQNELLTFLEQEFGNGVVDTMQHSISAIESVLKINS